MRECVPSSNGGLTVSKAVLLAGGLKAPPLAAAAGCSVLDLWLTPSRTVMDLWVDRFRSLGDVDIKVVCSRGMPRPSCGDDDQVELIEDAAEFRGPAGALRDACTDLAPDETILVGEATRFVDADLTGLIATHTGHGAAVTVACNRDRSPAGIYLLERHALDLVPPLGFMDLKEQWLGKVVASGLKTVVHQFEAGSSHTLRTREQFLAAARLANETKSSLDAVNGATNRIVSDRAEVHESARLWGSVVMGRAIVEPGAVIVRSLIGPGARVPRSAVIVDQVIPAVALA